MPAGIVDGLAALQALLEAKPDQTATEDARTFLTVAQDRWTRVRLAQAKPCQSHRHAENRQYDL